MSNDKLVLLISGKMDSPLDFLFLISLLIFISKKLLNKI